MTDDKRSGPPSHGKGGKGGDRRGPRKGGPRREGGRGAAPAPRAETYETVAELTRGAGFRIDKSVVAEKGTHRPVHTEYRLYREGLAEPRSFARLADAQTAATEPLPEPEPEPAEAARTEAAPAEAAEAPAEPGGDA